MVGTGPCHLGFPQGEKGELILRWEFARMKKTRNGEGGGTENILNRERGA